MNYLGANMKLIVECSQKLVRLGENLWGKDQKLDKEMQEHQKLCDEIMAIQEIEPIEAEMEQIIHCPKGYIFKDENGNVINATKIVLEKKKPVYPKSYEECSKIVNGCRCKGNAGWRSLLLTKLQELLVCRDAYWKLAGDWEPDWAMYSGPKHCIIYSDNQIKWQCKAFVTESKVLAFPTPEMRDAFYENFKELIEECKELL